MNHTPGPWHAKPETVYVPAQVWADGRELAEVYGETHEAREANARLMAAAPVMLEALRDALRVLKVSTEMERSEAIATVKEALDKALAQS